MSASGNRLKTLITTLIDMLFKKKDLIENEHAEVMASHEEKCARYISAEIDADIAKAIGELKNGCSYHFDTGTLWSLHELIVYLASQIGPCEMYFSTYAIKEQQARIYTSLKSDGIITKLFALLDYRIPTLDAGAADLLEENCTAFGYMRTHSKLTVLQNKKWGVVITGSANHTTNTTADTGVITCVPAIAQYRANWIIKHIGTNETN